MGTGLGILAADGPDFMIHGLVKFHLFGQELWLTTTHVSVLVVCVLLIIFALIVRSKLRDTEGEPGTLQNIAEMVVEALDGMVKGSMGKNGIPYRNYIGTLFLFLIVSNLSGLLGLRPPTADYGVTLPLGVITFILIQYNNIRYNKVGAFTGLFKPLPILFPINLIGEIAVPFSLSLRLFGNVVSGTVIMGLYMACYRSSQSDGQVSCTYTLTSSQDVFKHMCSVCCQWYLSMINYRKTE